MDFSTVNSKEYRWPFPKPVLGKPCEPPRPSPTAGPRAPPVAPYCHCDLHSYAPRQEQYQQLLDKERKLCEDYQVLRAQMVEVSNDILDHPCDDLDSKMTTMYQATYKKRNAPVPEYRALAAAATSPAPVPGQSHRLGRLECYKDPTTFDSRPPATRPTIEPPGQVHLGVAPKSISAWFTDYPGRSEYTDNYSVTAQAFIRSMQRYKEPLPSTRRRADDRCT